MQIGYYISGAGHAALIGFLLFGGVLSTEPLPFETTTNVTVLSGDEFAALIAQSTPDAVAVTPDQTETPAVEDAPSIAETTPVEETPPPPPPQEAPEAETPPDVSALAPPVAEVEPEAPAEPTPPVVDETVTAALPEADQAQEQQADRVAPEAVAPPPPDAQVADTVQEAVTEGENAQQQAEEAQATAPEAAATEIVTEAETPASAPTQSMRPRTRPTRPEPVQTAETPVEDAPTAPANDAIADAVAQAVAEGQSTAAAASGPPLTRGERDALRVSVSNCWNVGSLSTDALATTVIVAVDMAEDATPVTSSIRMLSFSGGTEAGARQAFEAARRAIIRCGARGYNLPREKYAQWREIEMTFDPSGMRLR